MTHVSEEQLIALALDDLGEDERRQVQRHLDACSQCAGEARALRETLETAASVPVPERGDGYGAEVWARIEPRLQRPRTAQAVVVSARVRGWLAAAAVLLAIAGAFLAGRFSRESQVGPSPAAVQAVDSRAIRERVVLAAVGDHLDRTERALVELVNAGDGATVDISAEQAWARDLLDANRLYRQSVRGTGSPALSQVLDELEPVLLDIIHSPSRLSGEEFDALRSRIEDRSLVFKLRVSGADVRARQQKLLHSGEKTS